MMSPSVNHEQAILPSDRAAPGRTRRTLLYSLLITMGGIALSALLSWKLTGHERQLAEVQFKLDADKRIEAIQRTATDRLETVGSVAAFFAGSTLVDRKEFRTFTGPILETHTGIQSLAWAPRIPAARRKSHEQTVRDEGFANYEIHHRDEQWRFVPAGQRDEHYPILFVEPFRKNQSLIGLDLESNAACRSAIQRAMATGRKAAAIGPSLDDNETDSHLLYVVEPASNDDPNRAKRPADQPETGGIVLGVFQIGTLVESALRYLVPVGIDIRISALPDAKGNVFTYTRFSPLRLRNGVLELEDASSVFSAGGLQPTGGIEVADLRCTVDCAPMASYLARDRTWGPVGVFGGGLILTFLTVVCLRVMTGQKARVEQLVAKRTRELAESEWRFRHLVENAGDAFFLHEEKGRFLDVNKQACDSLGYTREELLLMTILDVDVQFVSKNLEKYLRLPTEDYPVTFEGRHRRKDGSTFPVEIRLAVLETHGRRLMHVLARDITDRKRAEERLREDRRLLREMLESQESDRKLVAYEIHDGLAQELVAAIYKFQSVEQLRDDQPDAAREEFDAAVRLLREAMAETRRLISGLRPPVLDESGVVAAIECLIAENRHVGCPEIEFVHELEPGRLAPPLEGALFRIVQEGLTNACRHSGSRKVRVELGQTGGRVRVEVRDWGVGFDPAQVPGGHFGLHGIRERARQLSGSAAIETAPQQGTRVIVELPLVMQSENGGDRNGANPLNGDPRT